MMLKLLVSGQMPVPHISLLACRAVCEERGDLRTQPIVAGIVHSPGPIHMTTSVLLANSLPACTNPAWIVLCS